MLYDTITLSTFTHLVIKIPFQIDIAIFYLIKNDPHAMWPSIWSNKLFTGGFCCVFVQIITMRDYIPKILGSQAFDRFMGKYEGYSERLNPTLSNVFATAAFRFGHTTISPRIQRLDESYKEHATYPSINLHKTFFSPWRIIKEGEYYSCGCERNTINPLCLLKPASALSYYFCCD